MAKIFDKNLSLVFGLYGKGKTYYSVKMALEAYLDGCVVISNTWLAFPHIRYYVPSDLPPILDEIHFKFDNEIVPSEAPISYLVQNEIEYKNTVDIKYFIICDEAGLFFNNRNFKENFDNPKMLEMFVQPRKYNMQIVCITQDLEMVDVNFIRLSQEVIEMVVWLWLFRRAYSYDKKYINLKEGWNPEIPIIAKKTWLHIRQISIDNSKHFGGLYFTREILGTRAMRSKNTIRSLKDYLLKNDYTKPSKDWALPIQEKLLYLLEEKSIFVKKGTAKKNLIKLLKS